MISWMTIAILSLDRTSTRGRAPWFSAIIRFWIRVESLNRPPTLLTISSSFSSSSIAGSSSAAIPLQKGGQPTHGLFELVVRVDQVELGRINVFAHEDLEPGGLEAPLDRRLVVG